MRASTQVSEELLDGPLLREIRGVEALRCRELPERYMHYVGTSLDCNALLVWVR